MSQLPNSSSITSPCLTSPDLTWTITVPPLSPVLGPDNIMSCSQCYPFVIYRLIWRLLALLRPMQPALRTPRCRAQRTITIKNVTLRWCIAHCSSVPLSSTKYRAWSDIIVTGDTDWSACTYRAPSIVTLRYRDILIFYSNNFPSLNVVLIF